MWAKKSKNFMRTLIDMGTKTPVYGMARLKVLETLKGPVEKNLRGAMEELPGNPTRCRAGL